MHSGPFSAHRAVTQWCNTHLQCIAPSYTLRCSRHNWNGRSGMETWESDQQWSVHTGVRLTMEGHRLATEWTHGNQPTCPWSVFLEVDWDAPRSQEEGREPSQQLPHQRPYQPDQVQWAHHSSNIPAGRKTVGALSELSELNLTLMCWLTIFIFHFPSHWVTLIGQNFY